MNTWDLLQAVALLGAPLVALSWFIFSWLFADGAIDRQDDHGAITARLKLLKKSNKGEAKETKSPKHIVYDKWMWFGSGFYGLAGLWTFLVVEVVQFFNFVFNFPGLNALFGDGLISFLIDFGLNQLGNIIQAFVWFTYWPADSILLWVMIAYLGYWAGVEMARRQVQLPLDKLSQALQPMLRSLRRDAGQD